MKIAVFSDVHGNLSALQAVYDSIRQQSDIDEVIFAGDLCVFGPRPQACVQFIRDLGIRSVVGNTDEWILRPPSISAALPVEQRKEKMLLQSICLWTRNQLDVETLSWIESNSSSFQLQYPPSGDKKDQLLIVHANPVDLHQLIFPPESDQLIKFGRIRQSDDDLAPLLDGVEAKTIAFGHLHIPSIRYWKDLTLVNVSSVSLPGDGDSRAKYATFDWTDTSGWTAEHIRVSYEISPEIEAYRQLRPPGWEVQIEKLESLGHVSQIV